MSRQPIALIDLDGTLADFDGAMRHELAKLDEIARPVEAKIYSGEAEELLYMAARRALIKAKPGFWRDLNEIPFGFAILEELRAAGFRIHVATRASKKYPGCWAEKIQWCEDTFGLDEVGITITTDKSLIFGDVLVDDWPPYFEGWLRGHPTGRVIAPAQPWNKGHGAEWAQSPQASVIRLSDQAALNEIARTLFAAVRR